MLFSVHSKVLLLAVMFAANFHGGTAASAQDGQRGVRGVAPAARVSACPPHRGSNIPRASGPDATPAQRAEMLQLMSRSPTGRTIVGQFSQSMTQAAAKRQNTTRVSYEPKHGTQVSFSMADGRIYLWYPGNDVVLPGEWRACEDRFSMTQPSTGTVMFPYGKVCFRYNSSTFNPVTGAGPGEWECAAASQLDARLVEQRAGDIFGLAKARVVPFKLPKDKTTVADLLARMPKDRRP